jgi:cytochrome c oxidase cbb3-type subunit 3
MATDEKNISNGAEKDTPSAHEYDGIKELNNPSPKWIIIVFYVTIAFSLLYAIHFFGHPNNKRDQYSEYERKVEAFEQKKSAMQSDAAAAAIDMDEAAIFEAGGKLYAEKGCIACHGANGEGNAIGPNLADSFWLNGCSEEDVIRIIAEGKPEKGMTPYKSMMSETQIKHLTQFILGSMVGSEPDNAKEAQGEECN